MLRGHHGTKFCWSNAIWLSKRDAGGEANLSQLYADIGRCRKREVEREEREERSLMGLHDIGTRSIVVGKHL